MAAVSPDLNFPLEEIEERLLFIESRINSIIDAANRIQNSLVLSETKNDSEEKKLLDTADHKMNEVLSKMIGDKFMDDSIDSEPSELKSGTNNFTWVIDPIDGSMNFLRRIPLYTVSIGLKHRDHSVAGIIILPGLRDVYKAISGYGAFKNGSTIRVSEVKDLERSLLISSFPSHRKEILRELLADLSAFVTSGRSIRRTGSITLDCCWLAEGRIDGLWEKKVNHWDLSAASVIVQEAGGRISDFNSQSVSTFPSDIVGSNGNIHNQILDVLKKSRREIGLN